MISIIVCSTSAELKRSIETNVSETIGVEYEILIFDNLNSGKGIAEVYNLGAEKAKYDLLCFMHEDILMHTYNWGRKVLDIMVDKSIGLLGIAGSNYKSLTPTGWACPGLEVQCNRVNIIQRFKFSSKPTKHEICNPKNEKLATVSCIDGVWMCTKKSVIQEFKFDEKLLEKFHGYDIDFSLQLAGKYKVAVTYDVVLEHFSEGNYTLDWAIDILKVNEKHKAILPLKINDLSDKTTKAAEKLALKDLLKRLSKTNYTVSQKIGVLWKHDLLRVLGIKNFIVFNFKILFLRY